MLCVLLLLLWRVIVRYLLMVVCLVFVGCGTLLLYVVGIDVVDICSAFGVVCCLGLS